MKNIYFFSPYMYISNAQMTKDTVWIPYLLHKKYGYYVRLIFCKSEAEYPYMKYVEGIDFDVHDVPEGKDRDEKIKKWTELCCEIIAREAEQIDILYCFGSYSSYTAMIPLYKRLHPKGKVIVKLDANIKWINDISYWTFSRIHLNADLITVECKSLMRFLNRKWKVKVKYLTNGYVELGDVSSETVDFAQKQNVILTVGRIGTEQKANHVMLEAFKLAADRIPGWKLRFVGEVTAQFKEYADKFFNENPSLRERVEFAGRINDKNLLRNEYKVSKIFCLSSLFEGGTPNVVSEAMENGCYMIASEYDAYAEQIAFGACGLSFPINDVERLAECYAAACSDPEMEKKCLEIQTYRKRIFDYEKQTAKLNYWIEHLEDRDVQDK